MVNVGDLVECRRTGSSAERKLAEEDGAGKVSYVQGRVVAAAGTQDGGETRWDVELETREMLEGVPESHILRRGETAHLWKRVQTAFHSAASTKGGVRQVLSSFLGPDFCVVPRFCEAVAELERMADVHDGTVIDATRMTQVLWQKGLLDALGEVVLCSKLRQDPDIGKYTAAPEAQYSGEQQNQIRPEGIRSPTLRQNSAAVSAAVDRAFSKHQPIKLGNLIKVLTGLNAEPSNGLTTAQRDGIKSFFKIHSLGPRTVLSRPQLLQLVQHIQLQVAGASTESDHFGLDPVERVEEDLRRLVQSAHEQGIDCRDLFESLDTNGDGRISLQEFIKGLGKLGINLDETLVDRMLAKRKDVVSDGFVKFRQFLSLISPEFWQLPLKRGKGEWNDRATAVLCELKNVIESAQQKGINLQESFNLFDVDNNGLIDRKEFRSGLDKLGIHLSKEETRMLMRMFEGSNSYMIDFKSFRREMESISGGNLVSQGASKPLQDFLVDSYSSMGIDWREVLESFDHSYSGKLPVEVLHDIFSKNGLKGWSLADFRKVLHDTLGLATADQGMVPYAELILQLCPQAWSSGGHRSYEKLQLVHHTMDSLVQLVRKAREKGVPFEESFNHFDINHNGLINAAEMYQGLKRLGLELNTRGVRMLMREFEGEVKSHVNREDFVATITKRIEVFDKLREALQNSVAGDRKIFKILQRYDIDHTGKITPDEFLSGLHEIGIDVDSLCNDLHHAVPAVFFARSGAVRYQAFLKDALVLPPDASEHVESKTESDDSLALETRYRQSFQDPVARDPCKVVELAKSPEKPAGQQLRLASPPQDLQSAPPHVQHTLTKLRNLIRKAELQGVGLAESFEHFDTNRDSRISEKEFRRGLAKLDFDLSKDEVAAVMAHFETVESNGKPYIDLQAFYDMFQGSHGEGAAAPHESSERLLEKLRVVVQQAKKRGVDHRECFEHFDKDFSGTIDRTEFRTGLKRLGFFVSEVEANHLMTEFGVVQLGGEISYANFLRMIGAEDDRLAVARVMKRLRLMVANLYASKFNASGPLASFSINAIGSTGRAEAQQQQQQQPSSLRALFADFDSKRDGIVSRTDFLMVLRKLELDLSDQDYHVLFGRLDPNADGLVDYADFVDSVEPPRTTMHLRSAAKSIHDYVAKRRLDRRAVLHPFQHFDLSHHGVITKREFRCGLSALSFQLKQIEVHALCDALDLHADGKVHYEVFAAFAFPIRSRAPGSPGGRGESPTSMSGSGRPDPISVLEEELLEFFAMAEAMNIPLRETFRHFDKDNDGTITWEEFHGAMVELGFECTASQLRKLMERVRSFDAASRKSQQGRHQNHGFGSEDDLSFEARAKQAEEGQDRINYDIFLKYWAATKRPAGEEEDTRTDQEIMEEVKKLRTELKQFLVAAGKRGVKVSEVFSHFDENADGTITTDEFRNAITSILALDNQLDDRVLEAFMGTLDDTRDGKIDYYEFLGIKRIAASGEADVKDTSWQAVFGSRRAQKQRAVATAVAQSIVQFVVRKAEIEISRQGPLWQQARRNLANRVNNGTFIQRNKAAVRSKVFCERSARTGASQLNQDQIAATTEEKLNTSKPSASLAKKLELAERIHTAEVAAARMAEEANLRAEEAANQQQSKSSEEEAVSQALRHLHGTVVFLTKKRVVSFLQAIGLGRFQDRIMATHYQGLDGCYVFPVEDDQDMQDVLGTCSMIVARKVKRELLGLLRMPSSAEFQFSRADGDPQHWTTDQVEHFAGLCGIDVNQFGTFNIDGEALLELEFHEAVQELDLKDEIATQKLLFRALYLHHVVQGTYEKGSQGVSLKSRNARVFTSLCLDQKVIARPNNRAIESWSVAEVVELFDKVNVPELSSKELRKLGIDGATLVELTDHDIRQELGLQDFALDRFRGVVEALRQPPWMSLGVGPYLEARVAAGLGNDSTIVTQTTKEQCTYFAPGREHELWIHVGPALLKAFEISQRALKDPGNTSEATRKPLLDGTVSGGSESLGQTNPTLAKSEDALRQEESRLVCFVQESGRGGLPVLETFGQFDKDSNGLITWFEFEQAVLTLGFVVENPGLFRAMLRTCITQTRDTNVLYREFYVSCMNRAEFHQLVFDRNASDKGIAFTADGFMASLLSTSIARDGQDGLLVGGGEIDSSARKGKIRVRYGGGSTFYDAQLLADHEDGTFEVKYSDSNDVEVVPCEWVDFAASASATAGPALALGARDPRLAIAPEMFSTGVHIWSATPMHITGDVVVGVWSEGASASGRRFFGINSQGALVFKGYGRAHEDSIRRFAKLEPLRFEAGRQLLVRVDLEIQQLELFVVPGNGEAEPMKTSAFDITKLQRVARVHLDEIYRSSESSSVEPIKSFVMERAGDLEDYLSSKLEQHKHTLPVSTLVHQLLDMGLQADEVDVVNFLQPFLHEHKYGIKVADFLEVVRLSVDHQWDESRLDGTSSARGGAFGAAVLLVEAGDSVRWSKSWEGANGSHVAGRDASKLKVHDRVKVRYGGGSIWYEGTIVGVDQQSQAGNVERVFSVRYDDDNDIEHQVQPENIQLLTRKVEKLKRPTDKLVLRLFCRLLAYSAPEPQQLSTRERRRLREGATRDDSATFAAVPPLDVEMRGLTFSNVGNLRLQELLRKRLNEPDSVNWSLTVNADYQFFAPLAMEQSHAKRYHVRNPLTKRSADETKASQPQSQKQGTSLSEDEWTLLGTIAVDDMPQFASGELGVPFTIRLGQNELPVYYRICVMGVLGTLNAEGIFSSFEAPVEPVQSVMRSKHARVGGGYDFDIFASLGQTDEVKPRASRFFLLSGAFKTANSSEVPRSSESKSVTSPRRWPESSKPKPNGSGGGSGGGDGGNPRRVPVKPKPKKPRGRRRESDERAEEHEVRRPRTSPIRTTTRSPRKPRSRSPQKRWGSSSPSKAPKGAAHKSKTSPKAAPQRGFSQDERIIIDRWLALVGLNEYGEPADTDYGAYGSKSRATPLFDPDTGERIADRYDYVLSIHSTRPWMNLARNHGWLPSKEEQRKIRKWARRTGSDKPSRRSKDQTLYEALVFVFPEKPWLDHSRRYEAPRPLGRSKRIHKTRAVSEEELAKEERRLKAELESTKRNVVTNLDGIEKDFEKIAKVQAGLQNSPGSPGQSLEDIKRESQLLALQATARANEEAQVQWEREESIRLLKQIDQDQVRMEYREREQQALEREVDRKSGEQRWAAQVSSTFAETNPKPSKTGKRTIHSNSQGQQLDDPWVKAVSKNKKNCPI
ncbi:EF-hand calcium-binding domain-containing protein 6 (CAP-binding protein complex-interacting protein 1) (DJ-1-binding protein) (DJBP) [Durusdinium trenchii]|uniref:EF-hand calcium-binding domain-containing protein 6 (CAP-binding protein complex-interacting protein 1) (DJ-1-binding protein) (DJBP) n=1 Tax=Durusdinium trenchii TaxID=1381693 RepID=A0ABP0Q4I3_9DINO